MPKPFHWFGPASVVDLTAKLLAHPVARLEVHEDGPDMTLLVIYADEVVTEGGGGGVNDSHICPPVCP